MAENTTRRSDPLSSADAKKVTKLDDKIGSALYNVAKDDEKSLPKDDPKFIDRIGNIVDDVNNVEDEPVFDDQDIVKRLNSLNISDNSLNINTARNISSQLKNNDENGLVKELETGLASASLADEGNRISRYNDYDAIDTSIPELSTALDVYRDAILSPDDITKKSLMYYYESLEDNNLNKVYNESFTSNMKKLIEKFKLDSRVPMIIRDGLKYGDSFIAVFDINKEANELLNENYNQQYEKESIDVLNEANFNNEQDNALLEKLYDTFSDEEILTSLAISSKEDKSVASTYKKLAAYSKEKNETKVKINTDQIINQTKKDLAQKINKNLNFYSDPKKLILKSTDKTYTSGASSKVHFNLSGAYMKIIDPRDIIKLEIDDICLGYIYFEPTQGSTYDTLDSSMDKNNANSYGSMITMMSSAMSNSVNSSASNYQFTQQSSSTTSSTSSADDTISNMNEINYKNTALRYQIITDLFIRGIGKKLNKRFINKNKDLHRFIYNLIKQDYLLRKQVRITFLEPDQVVHLKLDSVTNTYGVSRLASSLLFAKLYLSILLTNVITKITKGKDRRVYYVDVGLDDDVEGTVQSLIRDFRSDEFNTGVFGNDKSISTMLKQLGSGKEAYVPVIDGNAPFNIDSIPGEQVDINDEFLEMLKKSLISSTGVPANYIDATQDVDYARSLSMQNNAFLRNVTKYQSDFSIFFSKVVRKLYQIEYQEDLQRDAKAKDNEEQLDVNKIFITFPKPMFLSIQNINEQISNISQTIEFVTNSYISDDDVSEDESKVTGKVKNRLKLKLSKNMIQTLDWDMYDTLLDQARIEINKEIIEQENDTKSDGEDSSDDSSGSAW